MKAFAQAAEPAHRESLQDGLAEACWLFRMARLGLGFHPDLLAYVERFHERAGTHYQATHADPPHSGTHARPGRIPTAGPGGIGTLSPAPPGGRLNGNR